MTLREEKRMENSSSFFANRACRYFPCHEGIPEEEFNCLFCYCPLYLLGERCGGDLTALNPVSAAGGPTIRLMRKNSGKRSKKRCIARRLCILTKNETCGGLRTFRFARIALGGSEKT